MYYERLVNGRKPQVLVIYYSSLPLSIVFIFHVRLTFFPNYFHTLFKKVSGQTYHVFFVISVSLPRTPTVPPGKDTENPMEKVWCDGDDDIITGETEEPLLDETQAVRSTFLGDTGRKWARKWRHFKEKLPHLSLSCSYHLRTNRSYDEEADLKF